jgi:hypothetical protein
VFRSKLKSIPVSKEITTTLQSSKMDTKIVCVLKEKQNQNKSKQLSNSNSLW